MKRLKYIAVSCLAALALTSCEDFLEKTPYDVVDPNETVNDAVALALTNGCYTCLQSSDMYNMRLWTTDILAGNSIVGAGGGTDGLETVQAANFTTLSDNGMALYMWRSTWVGIGHCNDAIQALENMDNDITPELRDRLLGETYFLRAHYYYVLARLYGALPLRKTSYIPGTDSAIARATLDETYDFIIDDCTKAAKLLPPKAEYDSANVGRACREAALTMLADIYLTLAPKNANNYANVVELCDQVTSLGYNLDGCNYADNFNALIKNGPESIFEVQFSGDTEYDFWGSTPQSNWGSTFMGPRNSNMVAGAYGWNQPTQEFMDAYEDGDLRKDVTVLYDGCPAFDGMDYKSSWSITGYNVRKFLVPKSISPEYNTNPANFVVYRYAQVLLMQAEALNEMGKPSDAVEPLNIVRNRAGLKPIARRTSKEDLREIIIHEYRMELAFEGHRWFDLIRIGDGSYAVKFLHSIGKSNVTRDRLIFPIPQTEMDANPLMTQNPGY